MPLTVGNPLDIWSVDKIPDLSEKTCVITGGSEGIGAATVNYLLQHKVKKVWNLSNDPTRDSGAREFWDEQANENVSSRVEFVELDLGNYQAVRQAAKKIQNATDQLDILICNAAIGMYAEDVPSKDSREGDGPSIDRHFAVNNVGHAVLTQELLPQIKAAAQANKDARIVYLASNLHYSCPKETSFASLDELNKPIGPTLAYNRTKMGNVLYVKRLARDLKETDIFVNSVHPGVVKTAQQDGVLETYGGKIKETLGETAGGIAAGAMTAANYTARALGMKDSLSGCLSTLYAATAPEVRTNRYSGEFVVPPGHVQQADDRALDTDFQDRCYNLIQTAIDNDYGNDRGKDHSHDTQARGSSTI
ncbi:hypothetical protein PYCC9005_005502 [Savitreella phatthalungensis]